MGHRHKLKVVRTLVKLPGQRPVWVMAERSLKGLEEALFGDAVNAGRTPDLTVERIATDWAVAYRPRHLRVEKKTGIVPPFNCHFLWRDIHGPLLLVGMRGDRFCDVPEFVKPSLWFEKEDQS